MDRHLVLLNQNIARLRRDVRLQAWEIEQLIAADIDCTSAAQRLMRMQADLVRRKAGTAEARGTQGCLVSRPDGTTTRPITRHG
jgi:hypothetical protein